MSLAYDTMLGTGAGVIPIVRGGVLALDMCRRGGRAEVAAVFARSFYLRAGDMFICVGAPGIGNGPLTLIADIGGTVRPSGLGLRPGQRAEMSARGIAVGDAMWLGLENCVPWRAPTWPAAAPYARLMEACDALARRAVDEAPAEGLAPAVLSVGEPSADATPFDRTARRRIADFESWLSAGRGEESIRGLIGLGPGLTPSGDDFLSGALAVLDALGERKPHADLAQAVITASSLTSPLSACFLRAAAGGHIGEQFHDAVAALIVGDVDAAIAAARHIGHSSGWDMLAGAATALRIVARP